MKLMPGAPVFKDTFLPREPDNSDIVIKSNPDYLAIHAEDEAGSCTLCLTYTEVKELVRMLQNDLRFWHKE